MREIRPDSKLSFVFYAAPIELGYFIKWALAFSFVPLALAASPAIARKVTPAHQARCDQENLGSFSCKMVIYSDEIATSNDPSEPTDEEMDQENPCAMLSPVELQKKASICVILEGLKQVSTDFCAYLSPAELHANPLCN